MDGMAEGLEEESKKSLQMEAELEKQLAQFDTERQQMRALLQRRDDRYSHTLIYIVSINVMNVDTLRHTDTLKL